VQLSNSIHSPVPAFSARAIGSADKGRCKLRPPEEPGVHRSVLQRGNGKSGIWTGAELWSAVHGQCPDHYLSQQRRLGKFHWESWRTASNVLPDRKQCDDDGDEWRRRRCVVLLLGAP